MFVVLGLANVVGLLLEYTGLRRGKVGVVVAITSTEGAVAAILAAIFGEAVPAATAVLLALTGLMTLRRRAAVVSKHRRDPR